MVYVKRLTVQGFKSFGLRKTSIEFEKGLVVVTGPNGGGKSNILDAIRFALGELSAHNLRVGRMSELVHDNASNSVAKVSLTLDNSERILPVDSSEVTITRRLDRNGESEYLLNGRQVSRAELLTILTMANIKPSGFNIVPQASVTSIAEMSNIELRKTLEDVSGIGEYERKKQEAEAQLQIAEKNIAIAKAGTTEVKARVSQLQRERNEAYRRRQVEKILSAIRSIKLKKIVQAFERELIDLDAESSLLEEEIAKLEENERRYRNELSKTEQEWIEISKDISQLEEKMRQIEKIREELRQREITLTSEKSTISERLRNVQVEISNLERLLKENSSLKQNLSQRIIDEKAKCEQLKENLNNIVEAHRRHKQELDTLKNKLSDLERRHEDANSRKSKLEKEIEILQIKIAELERKYAIIREESLENLRVTLQKILERKRIRESYQQCLTELRELELRLERISVERNVLKNRVMKAEEIERNLSKLIQAIASMGLTWRRAMEQKIRNAVASIDGVYGFLKDWIDVEDPAMLVRIEAGSSGWTRSLIVDNWRIGNQLAEIFHQAGLKIKIIPLEKLAGTPYHKLENVKPRTKWAGEILSTLLKNVQFRKKGEIPRAPHMKIVDGKGITYYSDGRIEVSTTALEQNIIQLEYEYDESIKILNHIRSMIEELQKRIYNIEEEEREKFDERSRVKLEKELRERTIYKLGEEIFASFLKFVHLDIEKIKLKKELLEKQGELNARLVELEEIGAVDRAGLQLLREEVRKREEEFLNVSTERKELEIELRQALRLVEEYRREYERLESQCEKIRLNIEEKLKEEQMLERELGEILNELEHVRSSLENCNVELNAITVNIQHDKLQFERCTSTISSIRGELRSLESRIQELIPRRMNITIRRNKLESEMKRVIEELNSLPVSDFADIPVEKVEELESELNEELKELEMINQLAAHQYEEVVGNYKMRSLRIGELEEERKEIVKFVDWLENEKKRVFLNTFSKVSENFERYFSILTGGQGWLKLEDSDNPFNKGLEMILRFPGKIARSARSASGGEKSVAAIALLLALQGLTPAEFYIFDEVDAHMDVQYSTRLAELFNEMSKNTQIIVISLKDVIAEKADQLIGVYNKNGESRVVKMKVEEVVDYG